MTIHIEELKLNVIIGILDYERTSKQTVIIETKINYNYQNGYFINYATVIEKIENLLEKGKYELLEEALNDIGTTIIKEFSQINSLYIKISKPDIIKNAIVSLSKEWI